MTDNLEIWRSLERTDPKHVKEITGKTYKGNSPRPHWVIWKLTEKFGPVGQGFGWDVVSERYVDSIPRQDGTEQLHEIRIRFWHTNRGCFMDSYGATKALYKAKVQSDGTGGYWVSDEDAAKKSLTDAITKAASWLGVAADIFMGRWDDSKYVAGLHREAANQKPEPAQASGQPDGPVYDGSGGDGGVIRQTWEEIVLSQLPPNANPRQKAEAYAEALITKFRGYKSLRGLTGAWENYKKIIDRLQENYSDLYGDLYDAYDLQERKLKDADATPIVLGEQRVPG